MRKEERILSNQDASVFISIEAWEEFERKKVEITRTYSPDLAGAKIRELSENLIQEGVLNG